MKPCSAGHAEFAPHPASGLCGDTNRPVVLPRDENTFDKKIVFQSEEDLFRAVLRNLYSFNLWIHDSGQILYLDPEDL